MLPVLTEVAAGVWVAHAAPYATTSTVVVAGDGAALLVDPGVTQDELSVLAAQIARNGWRVVAGFSTHPHWDHLTWSDALGDVPRWARPGAVVAVRERRAALVAEATAAVGAPAACFGRLTALGVDDGEVPAFGVRAVVVGHEGHACGHAALYLPAARALLAGDMLSDVEIPLLDLGAADPLGDYAAGLERIGALIERGLVDVVVPGHGAVASAQEARRRLALDRIYLADLHAGRPSGDPRLGAGPSWLLAEHRAQVDALSATLGTRAP